MNILREVREKKGMTQSDIADKLGVSLRTYQRIEKAPDTRKVNDMSKIMSILGINGDQIVTGSNNTMTNGKNNIVKVNSSNSKTQTKIEEEILSLLVYASDAFKIELKNKLLKLKEVYES